LRDRGVEDERIEVIRSAVDADRFSNKPDCTGFRKEFGLPNDALVIAAAGQLIPRKGHRYLLEAVAKLRQSQPSLRLIIFGEGYLGNQLRAQAETLGIEGVVTFAGFRADLDDFMGCFDLFVHPALAEGLGVATLKAQAAGVAVIGFAAGGLPEAVEHEKTGLLVPPEDVVALQTAIRTLIEDDERRGRYGDAGQKRMQNEFSIATMAARHVELYESILDG
jgi:glycosyltransferase involved in cell wall biosynthesis